jgi:hypothetical protein
MIVCPDAAIIGAQTAASPTSATSTADRLRSRRPLIVSPLDFVVDQRAAGHVLVIFHRIVSPRW